MTMGKIASAKRPGKKLVRAAARKWALGTIERRKMPPAWHSTLKALHDVSTSAKHEGERTQEAAFLALHAFLEHVLTGARLIGTGREGFEAFSMTWAPAGAVMGRASVELRLDRPERMITASQRKLLAALEAAVERMGKRSS